MLGTEIKTAGTYEVKNHINGVIGTIVVDENLLITHIDGSRLAGYGISSAHVNELKVDVIS